MANIKYNIETDSILNKCMQLRINDECENENNKNDSQIEELGNKKPIDNKKRYQLRSSKQTSYEEQELPPDDHYIYCDQCSKEHLDFCTIHGDLTLIKDTQVPKYPYNINRAKLTIPEGWLTVKPSKIRGLGVWSLRYIPEYVKFGPYDGIITNIKNNKGYSWELRQNGRQTRCVDASDPGFSNWMRYVNCARNTIEQNLVAFQYCGQLYYRSVVAIEPYTELLTWYGENFARELGVNVKLYNLPLKQSLEDIKFECEYCLIVFDNPIHLEEHFENCNMKEHIDKILSTKLATMNLSQLDASKLKLPPSISNQDSSSVIETIIQKKGTVICIREIQIIHNSATEVPKDWEQLLCVNKIENARNTIKCTKMKLKQIENSTDNKSLDINNFSKEIDSLINEIFPCEICGKSFKKSQYLMRHLKEVHLVTNQYKCQFCHKVYQCKYNLLRHLQKMHTNRTYTCTTCNEKFQSKSQLTKHTLYHKKYYCVYCSKSYKKKLTLTKHLQYAHQTSLGNNEMTLEDILGIKCEMDPSNNSSNETYKTDIKNQNTNYLSTFFNNFTNFIKNPVGPDQTVSEDSKSENNLENCVKKKLVLKSSDSTVLECKKRNLNDDIDACSNKKKQCTDVSLASSSIKEISFKNLFPIQKCNLQ